MRDFLQRWRAGTFGSPDFAAKPGGSGFLPEAVRRLSVPASESQLGLALVVAAVLMAAMLWAILWQANIISYQRELIRTLSGSGMGGFR